MNKAKLGLITALLILGAFFLYAQESDPLVGEWENISGDWIYYFGDTEIMFRSNGTVIGEEGPGTWTVLSGGRLRIDYYWDDVDYFTFSVQNNILTITDSDGDSGRWRKVSSTTSPDIQNDDPLIGQWENISGDWIYYFGDSEIIFRANGTVIGEEGTGTWTVFSGSRLRVDYYGDVEYFTFSVRNNILNITDDDGDSGRWRKL